MTTSQNGWPVLTQDSDKLYEWLIPATDGDVILPLRRGPAGFLLSHWAFWFSDLVEPVFGRGDDFGWAFRQIAGSDEWSNHASGTAEDLNSSVHRSGVVGTFSTAQAARIRARLPVYAGAIRWGGDYQPDHVDEMHFEINVDRADALAAALDLVHTARGRQLLKANPSQKKYLS